MANKILKSFRISVVGKAILESLTDKLGTSQAAVVEMALRRLAEREGIRIKDLEQELRAETQKGAG